MSKQPFFCLLVSTWLFFIAATCYGGNIIDLFLQQHGYLSVKQLFEQAYDEKSTHHYARQFEKLFPTLYRHDKLEGCNQLENRLIVRLLKIFDSIIRMPQGLSWCGCDQAPPSLRIYVALKILDNVLHHYSQSYPLVYTSYASGKLLQDFIVIAGLIELGYSAILINIIDIAYEKKRQDLAALCAQAVFIQQIRNRLHAKKQKDASYVSDFKIASYHNVYDYLEEIRRGVAVKSDILLMVDPGNDILHKDFEYYGSQNQASLLDFEFNNNVTHIALYIPRSKNIRYFYAQSLAEGNKEKLKKVINSLDQVKRKNNFVEYLVNAVKEKFPIKSVTFFQSPYRSFDDLKHDAAVQDAIIYQVCGGVVASDVRDNLPLKNFAKIWF